MDFAAPAVLGRELLVGICSVPSSDSWMDFQWPLLMALKLHRCFDCHLHLLHLDRHLRRHRHGRITSLTISAIANKTITKIIILRFMGKSPYCWMFRDYLESDVTLRTTLMGSMLGRISPSNSRPVDCQVNVFLSRTVKMLIAEVLRPSGIVAATLIIQRLSFLVHVASPKPPSESNTQDRIFPVLASQPMS